MTKGVNVHLSYRFLMEDDPIGIVVEIITSICHRPGSPVLRVEHRTSLKLKREVFEIVLFGAYSFERNDGGG